MTTNNLTNKKILIGITGGIAAYKSAELVRQLQTYGSEVQVVMTQNACKFITPLTMQTLSGKHVYTELFGDTTDSGMAHIELARWCDVVLVAPASAHFIACLAHGMADTLLNTLCMATTAPIAIAPAMNQQMWENPAIQENILSLDKRSIKIIGPDTGSQACGENGLGRMVETEQLISTTSEIFSSKLLANLKIMVTAGATREAIDPVRYITNHSSGRMAYAVAKAAVEAGANVTLISSATTIKPPNHVRYISVNSAEQMLDTVMADIRGTDIFIAAAAVADYKCANIAQQKIKKVSDQINLLLQKNPDILAEVTGLDQAPFAVGFAAETENLLNNARMKFKDKKLDMIATNLVGNGRGFNVEDNELEVFWQPHEQTLKHQTLQRAPKERLAHQLIRLIADHYHEKNST